MGDSVFNMSLEIIILQVMVEVKKITILQVRIELIEKNNCIHKGSLYIPENIFCDD